MHQLFHGTAAVAAQFRRKITIVCVTRSIARNRVSQHITQSACWAAGEQRAGQPILTATFTRRMQSPKHICVAKYRK